MGTFKTFGPRDLEGIRTALMTYRQQFLESRRLSFSTNIGKVWGRITQG